MVICRGWRVVSKNYILHQHSCGEVRFSPPTTPAPPICGSLSLAYSSSCEHILLPYVGTKCPTCKEVAESSSLFALLNVYAEVPLSLFLGSRPKLTCIASAAPLRRLAQGAMLAARGEDSQMKGETQRYARCGALTP
ncbi:unnamed protein product [Trichogramma brassicae]|uniref:Uncharacterized protein n=1 Tax=Trichogramma brassicae TaxID=86971 RepID=A0A6H5I0G9_9HYME|nr:unnamed protein product [Trichogramma brassicae]